MTPFLAYLARRKYELHELIEQQNEYSLYLSQYKGAYEELNGVIAQLPEWSQELIDKLVDELVRFHLSKEEKENEIPIQT